jgi:hypothetical protein
MGAVVLLTWMCFDLVRYFLPLLCAHPGVVGLNVRRSLNDMLSVT